MKKIVYLIFIISQTISSVVGQNVSSDSGLLKYQVFVGGNTFLLSEAKETFHDVVKTYKDFGIKLPIQSKYPIALILQFTLLHKIGESNYLGIGMDYTKTTAYSLYEDYSGFLRIKSDISLLSFKFIVERKLINNNENKIIPFLSFQSGIVIGGYSLSQQINMNKYVVNNTKSVVSVDGKGYNISLSLGLDYKIFKFADITTRFGYRSSQIHDPKGDYTVNGVLQSKGKLNFNIDSSGFIFLLGLSKSI